MPPVRDGTYFIENLSLGHDRRQERLALLQAPRHLLWGVDEEVQREPRRQPPEDADGQVVLVYRPA